MDLYFVMGRQIGAEYDEIGASRMLKRRKKQAGATGGDQCVGKFPRWRRLPVDACDTTPGTIPFSLFGVPDIGVISRRQVHNLIQRDLVGCQCRWRSNRSPLAIFLECCLRRTREIKRFDSRSVEPAPVNRRTGAAYRHICPFGVRYRWKISSGPRRTRLIRAPRFPDRGDNSIPLQNALRPPVRLRSCDYTRQSAHFDTSRSPC